MDAVVMCGGRGSRLEAPVEKPLYEVGGEAMVDRVLDALAASRVDRTVAAVSPHGPETAAHLAGRVETVDTPGEGYVADLGVALESVDSPALTVAADLPLLAGDAVDAVLAAHDDRGGRGSLTVTVPLALKEALGLSVDTELEGTAPTGVNVVGDGPEEIHVTHDYRLAVNVNGRTDAAVAEALA